MKISVFGIGYVGAVSAACLTEAGFTVIAVDNDPARIDCINNGRSPFIEPGLDEIIQKSVRSGNLSASADKAKAVAETEISLICVGTPSREDGSLNLDYVEAACEEIGTAIRDKSEFHIVVLRSTVMPGSARNVAIPALEKASGKKCGVGFGFASNPEFLREGSAVADYFNPPKIIIGASDNETAQRVSALYKDLYAPLALSEIETAEAVKYADNSWHATKVSFANELGNILHGLGVDSHEVMKLFFLDNKLNISKAYLLPGFAFGGSCLPKDVRALRAAGQNQDMATPFFDAVLTANQLQIERCVQLIGTYKVKKITLFGLAFKSGTDDLRESPLLALALKLIAEGYQLRIHDPAVCQAIQLHGQSYARHIPPDVLASITCAIDDAICDSELFVIGNNDPVFIEIIESCDADIPVLDLVRPKDIARIATRKAYKGISW